MYPCGEGVEYCLYDKFLEKLSSRIIQSEDYNQRCGRSSLNMKVSIVNSQFDWKWIVIGILLFYMIGSLAFYFYLRKK